MNDSVLLKRTACRKVEAMIRKERPVAVEGMPSDHLMDFMNRTIDEEVFWLLLHHVIFRNPMERLITERGTSRELMDRRLDGFLKRLQKNR